MQIGTAATKYVLLELVRRQRRRRRRAAARPKHYRRRVRRMAGRRTASDLHRWRDVDGSAQCAAPGPHLRHRWSPERGVAWQTACASSTAMGAALAWAFNKSIANYASPSMARTCTRESCHAVSAPSVTPQVTDRAAPNGINANQFETFDNLVELRIATDRTRCQALDQPRESRDAPPADAGVSDRHRERRRAQRHRTEEQRGPVGP